MEIANAPSVSATQGLKVTSIKMMMRNEDDDGSDDGFDADDSDDDGDDDDDQDDQWSTQYQSWRSLPSGKWCQKKKDLSPDQINENTCKELTPCILEQKYKNDDKQSEDLKVRVVCDSGAKITNWNMEACQVGRKFGP